MHRTPEHATRTRGRRAKSSRRRGCAPVPRIAHPLGLASAGERPPEAIRGPYWILGRHDARRPGGVLSSQPSLRRLAFPRAHCRHLKMLLGEPRECSWRNAFSGLVLSPPRPWRALARWFVSGALGPTDPRALKVASPDVMASHGSVERLPLLDGALQRY